MWGRDAEFTGGAHGAASQRRCREWDWLVNGGTLGYLIIFELSDRILRTSQVSRILLRFVFVRETVVFSAPKGPRRDDMNTQAAARSQWTAASSHHDRAERVSMLPDEIQQLRQ